MNRRGVALLAVLWVLVALMGVAGVTLAALRSGERASLNRLALTRGRWAAESCLAIVRARYAKPGAIARPLEQLAIDSMDLGAPIWCRGWIELPDTKVNLNRATPAMLVALVRDTLLVQRILAGRPWPDARAMGTALVGDTTRLEWLEAVFTVRGSGRIDPDRAPLEVLAVLPGMDRAGALAVLGARRAGRQFQDADQLIGVLPPAARVSVMADYPSFVAATEWAPSEVVLHLEGHGGATAPVARVVVTVIPLADRLAIVRREAR